MVFAFATDDRTLHAFADEAAATSYAEGIDVEDGAWLFFDQDGAPLEPVFTSLNKRARFTVSSGAYTLRRSYGSSSPRLLDLLPEIAAVHGELGSVEAVRQVLTNRLQARPGERVGFTAEPTSPACLSRIVRRLNDSRLPNLSFSSHTHVCRQN